MQSVLENARKCYEKHRRITENLYERIRKVECGKFENCYLKLNLRRNIEYNVRMQGVYMVTIGRELKGLISEEAENRLFERIKRLEGIHDLAMLELEECETCFLKKFGSIPRVRSLPSLTKRAWNSL
jgi:hypothetical protein